MKKLIKQGIFLLIFTLIGVILATLVVMSATKVDLSSYLADRDVNWLIFFLSLVLSCPHWVDYSKAKSINRKYRQNRLNLQFFFVRFICWIGIAGIWGVKLLPEKYGIISIVFVAILIFALVGQFIERKMLVKRS